MRLLGRIVSGTESSGELLVLPSFVCFEPSVHSAQRRVCTVKNGFVSKSFFLRIFKHIVQPVHDLLHLALETSNSLIFDLLGLLVHPPFPLQTVG